MAKNIKYLTKDFNAFKQQLIDYTKTYYPNNYNDFSPSSPGTMFIEMASYVGDVLSFYLDNQIQENFLQYARQDANVYSLAYMMGYKPKTTSVASTTLTFYQQVPSILDGSTWVPDFNYALKLNSNSEISSTNNNSVSFLVRDEVDFSFSSSLDPTEVSVYSTVDNRPQYFLLKKTRKATSGTINSVEFSFGPPSQFPTVEINNNNIIGILDCTDSEGNEWYEVDYLAQDIVFDSIKNTNTNDPNFSGDTDTPYLLKLNSNNDETIVPNPDNVGMGLPFEQNKLKTAFSPSNFIFTDSYGVAPSNTTLTINYLTGGGISANVSANSLTKLNSGNLVFIQNELDSTTSNTIFNSFQVTNLEAADGGGPGDSLEEIRQNSIAQYSSQLRTVTQEDYLIRALSLPSQFGSIAKSFAQPPLASSTSLTDENVAVIDLFCLSYNNQRQLQPPSTALKNNLKTYLSQYRMIGDAVNIKSGYVINIGVEFDIIVLPNYNSNEVITNCISSLNGFFNISKWQINQPIILRDIYQNLDLIEGVQTVKNVNITNRAGTSLGYSEYGYDIKGATIDGVIYPSIDPSIFEVKYPQTDIKGRVVSY